MVTEIAAVVAILGAVLGSVWCALEWRAKLTPEVRRLMVEMRAGLALEGDRSPERCADVARRQEEQLEELINRMNDRKLRRCCNEVLSGWRDVWFSARASPPASPVEVWHIMATKEAINVVLRRANKLERLLP